MRRKFVFTKAVNFICRAGSLVLYSPLLFAEYYGQSVSDYLSKTPSTTGSHYHAAVSMSDGGGIGSITNDIVTGPMAFARDLMSNICYILGFALLVIGFFQYKRHRQNPQEVPLGTPILTMIVGVILILLPLTYKLVQIVEPQGY